MITVLMVALSTTLLVAQPFVTSSSGLTASRNPHNTIVAAPSSTDTTVVTISPNATIDLNRSMHTITLQVTIANMTGVYINGFAVSIATNPHVLNATSLDYSTNILSSLTPQVFVENCINGSPPPGGSSALCQSTDGPGIVSLAETVLGGVTVGDISGTLFSVTFNVNTTAPHYSQIQLKSVVLSNGQVDPKTGQPVIIPTLTSDGYYTSLNCGGKPCSASSPDFTWSPKVPKQGRLTTFYGNASIVTPGATITDYSWTWGDTAQFQSPYTDSCIDLHNCSNSTATHIYNIAGTYDVTLQITDSYGVKASKTYHIAIVNADIVVGVQSVDVQPTNVGLNPGARITIVTIVRNYGVKPVNFSFYLLLQGQSQPLFSWSSSSIGPKGLPGQGSQTLSYTWDTGSCKGPDKPCVPNVYRVDAYIPPVLNQTDTTKNLKSVWIQLISPPITGFSLLSSAGLGVVTIGVLGYGVSRFRRRKVDDSL